MSSPPAPSRDDVTLLLSHASKGDAAATAELLPIVYAELRALAASFFGTPNPSRTLQPTALVHEAYLKLVRAPNQEWEGRGHFIAVASKAMRQVLMNHAREKRAQRRGGSHAHRVTLSGESDIASAASAEAVDLLALEEALQGLERDYPDLNRIVELKFFGGLTNEETAQVIGVTVRTIEREWRLAKAELRLRLGDESETEGT